MTHLTKLASAEFGLYRIALYQRSDGGAEVHGSWLDLMRGYWRPMKLERFETIDAARERYDELVEIELNRGGKL